MIVEPGVTAPSLKGGPMKKEEVRKNRPLLEGRVLARVHAHESLMSLVRGSEVGPYNLTSKGSYSDLDPDKP
jgi:hypothetical protein